MPAIRLSNNKILEIPSGLNIKRSDNGFGPEINLSNNKISDITPLANSIKAGIDPVNSVYKLYACDLSNNHISDISSLENIDTFIGYMNVSYQTINVETESLTGIELPQIFKQAISEGAEITCSGCALDASGNTVSIDTSNMSEEIGASVVGEPSSSNKSGGTKLTITFKGIPMITLSNKLTKDTYTKLDNDNRIMLLIRASNMTEETISNVNVKIKIGNESVMEGSITEVFEAIEHQEYNLWLGDTGMSMLNGRLTIEISAIEGGFEKTILDTKYIVDNTAPNPSIGENNEFKDGKARVTMQLDEPVDIIEDGQKYEVNYNEDGTIADIQDAGGWEKGLSTYLTLTKGYATPGDKTIRVIDRAGNDKDITFNIKGWISDIKLNTLGGTYKKGDTITVIAKYIGDDISRSTAKSKLKYSIGTGEVKEVEETSKDTNNNIITYTINIDQNDIGKLKYESISIRTNESFQPDFSSITVKQLSGIEIAKSSEFKLTYTEGEKLDLTGLTVSAKYSDNTSEKIDTTKYTVSPADGTILTKIGTNTVTVTYEGKTETFTIMVNTKATAVTGISLNKKNTSIKVGKTETLVATVEPNNATNKEVEWSSSNTAVATVNDKGVVTAIKEGTAEITVTTNDGKKTASCQVTVTKDTTGEEEKVAVTGVSLNKTTTTIKIGQTERLTVTITPSDATNKNVTWKSSDEKVVKVVDEVITGISEGTADITVTTEDGNKVATCQVTVTKSTSAPEDVGNGNSNGNGNNNNSPTTNKINTIENDIKAPVSKLPYAGLKEKIIIVSIISLIVVAIISFIKYKRCM